VKKTENHLSTQNVVSANSSSRRDLLIFKLLDGVRQQYNKVPKLARREVEIN
jgi:hypothetical protein